MKARLLTARVLTTLTTAAATLLMTSCAALDVNSLPQPGGSYSDGYDVVVEFSSVLNLPDQAKVVQDGTIVGVVKRVDLKSDRVDVVTRIGRGVVIPSNVHATLQQSTVLGDTYLAIERQQSTGAVEPAPPIPAGGRIPVANTASPPQLEDTIANLANFVGSGAIQRIQTSISGVNSVTPARREELHAMVGQVATDLSDLSNNMDNLDLWLQGVSGTADVINSNLATYQYWFSPDGMVGFDRITVATSYLGTVLPSVGSIYSGGFWLVPLLNSLGDAAGSLQQTKWDFEAEGPAWRKLFYDNFLPVDKNPAINITSITGPDGREMIGNVQDVLRILGATP